MRQWVDSMPIGLRVFGSGVAIFLMVILWTGLPLLLSA